MKRTTNKKGRGRGGKRGHAGRLHINNDARNSENRVRRKPGKDLTLGFVSIFQTMLGRSFIF
jgi:hypothetical protein